LVVHLHFGMKVEGEDRGTKCRGRVKYGRELVWSICLQGYDQIVMVGLKTRLGEASSCGERGTTAAAAAVLAK
jgi:hypothetical protein